jgi:hypothetical protein
MRTRKNPGAVAALGASVSSDQLARRVTSEANRQQSVTQARILVTLVGADRCSGEGVTAECSSASSGYHRSLVPAPPDPLAGTTVRLPNRCRCGARIAEIGAGAGPHVASLYCASCRWHRGWLSGNAHAFIAEIVNQFGRPITRVTIRRGHGFNARPKQ